MKQIVNCAYQDPDANTSYLQNDELGDALGATHEGDGGGCINGGNHSWKTDPQGNVFCLNGCGATRRAN